MVIYRSKCLKTSEQMDQSVIYKVSNADFPAFHAFGNQLDFI